MARGGNKVDLFIRLLPGETSDAVYGAPANAKAKAKRVLEGESADKFRMAAVHATQFLNGESDRERKRLSALLEYALRTRIDNVGIVYGMNIGESREKVYSVLRTNLPTP